ncbi:terminase small subunit [Desulfolutivibrio sp.]|uniref:terminase small subunit n=1 Tax=Desulfolutivibrio sp. TaxID=2773296 RepID=UPI002F960AC6
MQTIHELKERIKELESEIQIQNKNKEISCQRSGEIMCNEDKHEDSRGAGRPPYYSSVEEMQEVIDAYFTMADEKGWPYTIPDLALALGFTSRQSLLNYSCKPEYMDTIKRAKLRIEGQRARQLVQGQGVVAGQIFDLKNNFGWRDQQAQEPMRGATTLVQNNIGLSGMPPEPKDIKEWERWYRDWQAEKLEGERRARVEVVERRAL